jgi:hypothetical protein
MSTILQSARAICHTLLQHVKVDITPEIIESTIEKASAIDIIEGQVLDKQLLFEMLIADFSIGKGDITVMSDNIDPWLNEEKSNISFELWNRYKLYIHENDSSFPINDLDDFTDKILDKCVNPKISKSWDRRGMVLDMSDQEKQLIMLVLLTKQPMRVIRLLLSLQVLLVHLDDRHKKELMKGSSGEVVRHL